MGKVEKIKKVIGDNIKFILVILCVSLVFVSLANAEEFKWARAEFKIQNPKGTALYDKYRLEDWDIDMTADLIMLKELEKSTTIKPVYKVFTVKLTELNEMVKYPLIFMHASDYAVFSDEEVKNLREYLNRGGMIYADDCNAGPEGDRFWRSAKDVFENKVFPGKKFSEIPNEDPIFHCHFELVYGLPIVCGGTHPFLCLKDDKDRIMVFLSSADLHCGWTERGTHSGILRKQSIKMAINIIVYALTH
jgi:hypothetical protein